jgi:hypothetical protein
MSQRHLLPVYLGQRRSRDNNKDYLWYAKFMPRSKQN